MKKHKGKRKKKAKSLHAKELKETSNETYEIDPSREKVKEIKPDELKLNLVFEDHYSLYERTTVREKARKESENVNSEFSLENELGDETRSVLKGQYKSVLPPLKDKPQRRKRLTFEDKIRAKKHTIFDTKLEEQRNDMAENIAPTYSEAQKKLASLSFVGVYDLNDMGEKEPKTKNKLKGILKSTEGVDGEISCETKNVEEKTEEHGGFRAKGYVIQTLTLEGQSSLKNSTLFQDKFNILPDINKDSVHKTSQRKEIQYRNSKNRLPNIVQSENRNPRSSYRRKSRAHDNSFEQVYLQRNIPRLPVIVNGKITES